MLLTYLLSRVHCIVVSSAGLFLAAMKDSLRPDDSRRLKATDTVQLRSLLVHTPRNSSTRASETGALLRAGNCSTGQKLIRIAECTPSSYTSINKHAQTEIELGEPSAVGCKEVVLVTGGAGFLGQHIVKLLSERATNIKEIRVFDIRPWRNKLGKCYSVIQGDKKGRGYFQSLWKDNNMSLITTSIGLFNYIHMPS